MFNIDTMRAMLANGASPATVSVAKWESIREDAEKPDAMSLITSYARLDGRTCALCEKYGGKLLCIPCPLYQKTQLQCDDSGSLYGRVIAARLARDQEELIYAIDELLLVLRKLVAEGN